MARARKFIKRRKYYRLYVILLVISLSILAVFIYTSQESEWIPVINMTRVINNSDLNVYVDRKIEYTLVINIIDIKSLNIDKTVLSIGIASDCEELLNKSEFTFPVKEYEEKGEFKIKLEPGYKLCYIVLEDGISIYPYSSFSVEGPGRVILTFNYPSLRAFIKMDFVIEKMHLSIKGEHGRKLKLLVEWINANVTTTNTQYECIVPCSLTLEPPLFATSVNVYIHK